MRISCVSYLNSQPFIHGLRNSSIRDEIELSLDTPSVCSDRLLAGSVDIGLVPVAVMPGLRHPRVISEYCIGADGKVDTVVLLSDVPLDEIGTVLLDYQSRTSVLLAKVLAANYWHISPYWVHASAGFENDVRGATAGVVIGDRVFTLRKRFRYVFDLAEEWRRLTSLPFVFACWVSNREIADEFVVRFNDALTTGLEAIPSLAARYPVGEVDTFDYLMNKISFKLDERKREAMKCFFALADQFLDENPATRIGDRRPVTRIPAGERDAIRPAGGHRCVRPPEE